MASAEQLESGKWRGVYRVKGPDGKLVKRHTKAPHHGRKKDAKAAANELEVRAQRQAETTEGTLLANIKWGDWWDTIVEKRDFPSDTPTTEEHIVEGYLRPQWGEVPLNEIRQKAVRGWAEDLALGKEVRNVDPTKASTGPKLPGYVHRIYSVFNVSIKRALDEGVLTASPCVGIPLPKRPKRSRPYMSVTSAEKVGNELRDDYKDAIDFDLETGLRPNELCGLHIDRIDLETGWMEVHDVFVRRRRIIRPCPKDQDVRLVALSDRAIEIIERRKAGREKVRGCGVRHVNGTCMSDVLFRTNRDRVMNPDTLGYQMRNACRKAGVANRSPYTLRRGFATRVADGGLDAIGLARLMGWADINEAWAYVQQTPEARLRVLAALNVGAEPALRLLAGGVRPGTESGTDLDSQALTQTDKLAL